MRAIAVILTMITVVLAQSPEPKEKKGHEGEREIDIKGLKIDTAESGKLQSIKITTEKEFEEAIPDKDARTALSKKIDLKKEYLLLVKWAGSGGDRLYFETIKDKKQGEAVCVFTMKRGLTRDLRRHVKLFAIPKEVKHEFKESR